jgi:chemotaxis protein methyltransferase WspC
MKRIEQLLREEIGLDAASVGSSSIERTIRLRMKHLGLKRPEDYVELLQSTRGEMEELVESVVITETWFFRDRDPFVAFAQLALDWLSRSRADPLRILSVPCSSGEEPYSLAMALLDAPLLPERFMIDGVDISAHALARAERAVYGKNSFRGKVLDFRGRYFQQTKDGFALLPRVRECVRFHRANLLDDKSLAGQGGYDFIFCRNLLIYFDRATQALALERLHHLLSPEGMLFVGTAELPLAIRHGFVSANVPMAFVCRKAGTAPIAMPATSRQRVARPLRPVPTPPRDPQKRSAPVTESPPASAPAPSRAVEPTVVLDLADARQLADRGRLDEAAAICQSHLQANGPSAQAYYLLGLVHDANGVPTAMDYYRKALYLEPDHHESLLQMALLLEKNGNAHAARTYKRRAERIQSAKAKTENAK